MSRFINAVLLLLCSCFVQAQIQVEDAYVRGLPPGQTTTAAFMQLKNIGDEDIVITGANTNSSKAVEIHTHQNNNGMMSMKKVDQIVVPAKSVFTFKPGGHHFMLIGLKQFLKEGDSVSMQLIQGDGINIDIEAPVRSVLNEHVNHSHH